jgi:hypothetical protein
MPVFLINAMFRSPGASQTVRFLSQASRGAPCLASALRPPTVQR